ncbi:CaiB/BaiF CoA-transferase family protein [Conexibacter sp. SYSU D00693]|uniref:CaiB/BaiF CoA transferase family protein n=1 Tax=Conexibacter sp. SYSU D00693 TaxID=2812560 RepID=UPI00196B9C11|nr:CaiB/BaiF CoA-transferase family protein [Conexibacter sp. SYSU D00693]
MTGPLQGIKVLELGAIGPAPFAAMLLADMGAEVVRLDRRGGADMLPPRFDLTRRGRAATATVDLKDPADRETVLALCERADVLLEGFRPGVMERLGLGPDDVHARNPRIVFGRMTGYGQEGPLAPVAGHDVNYISVAGVLGAMARKGERPLFPLNLVGDYGGGAMFLAFGVVCGVLEAKASGRGQVVDAAMVDGAALLATLMHGFHAAGAWSATPGENLLDSGAPFYEVYETSDGGHVAVGALEPQFHARLLELLEIPAEEMPQWDKDHWDAHKQRLAEVFAGRTREEWAGILEHEEACATVVRGLFEAHEHPHMAARGTFVELDGIRQPAAAPRFSRTPGEARPPAEDATGVLADWGLDPDAVTRLTS